MTHHKQFLSWFAERRRGPEWTPIELGVTTSCSMALSSVLFRFSIELSDVDRSLYETLELRVACHPSEAPPFLLTRVIAYALNFQEGIEFSQGISTPDEPAIYVKDLTGVILLWLDIGTPSAKRLHKASKAARVVRIYTHRDPQLILDVAKGEDIYKAESIEIFSLSPKFLDSLQQTLERDNKWSLLHDAGELSISVKGKTVSGEILKASLRYETRATPF